MTAKEKAEDIYLKMVDSLADDIEIDLRDFNKWQESFKRFSLIAVDEMLSNDGWSGSREEWVIFKKYCEEVKHEIENL